MSDRVKDRPASGPHSHAERAQPACLGLVVSVSGSSATIRLSRSADPQIGELVRVETALGAGFAIISSMRSEESPTEGDRPVAEMELMGEAARTPSGALGPFRRGLSSYPTLGARVHRATKEDLARAYRHGEDEACVTVGTLHQDKSLPATIKIDEMLGKHFAILGATGTGKSCTVALVLQSILELCPNAHALLLDAHGEYAPAFRGRAEILTHRDLRLPFWMLTHEEVSEVMMGDRDDYAQEIELLGDLIRQAKAIYAAEAAGSIFDPKLAARRHRRATDISNFSVDTPTPYRMADLLRVIDERMGSLDHQSAITTHRRLRGRIDARLRDHRYDFMFGPDAAEIELADVLARLFRLPVRGKPLAILELSGLPSEVLSVIISVTARMAFDFAIRGDGQAPITLICEEAHKYIPADAAQGFQPARRSIARIAKEGRKYGVCLGIVTQRPSELDPTILSQCNTVFSMRLSNELDQNLVRSAVSDAAGGLMRFLPALATGEAIAFGDGVSLPMRLTFKRLAPEQRPGGGTPLFSDGWAEDAVGAEYARTIVARWRTNAPIDRRGSGAESERSRRRVEDAPSLFQEAPRAWSRAAPPPRPDQDPPQARPRPGAAAVPATPDKASHNAPGEGWGRPEAPKK